MDTADLFKGIAVVIDDEIGKTNANINKLIEQIKKQNIPYLAYTELPDASIIDNFEGISFLLLDWKLQAGILDDFITQGVTAPDTLGQSGADENITFLKKLRERCFIPVFIFTNENKENVIRALKDNDLYQEGKPNYIFVERKNDLTGSAKLFKKIDKWIRETPSIYVLAAWEKEYRSSKTKLFYDFYNVSPSWPNILWKSFVEDGVNMSLELGELITRNLYTRMNPFLFDEKILKKRRRGVPPPAKNEVRKVLEGERFIKAEGLHKDSIATGDIFKMPGGKFLLNIRPDCDCIPTRNTANGETDDVKLYLLQGSKITIANEKKAFRKKYGNFEEVDNQSIIFSIIDERTYDFRYKDLIIKNWSEIKDQRIGRLLPPYITRIQQRYALYLQRQGLPRTPEIAVLGS